MRYFLSDDLAAAIERGEKVATADFWGGQTEYHGHPVWWFGTSPDTWVDIANTLYVAGGKSKAIAEAMAFRFGLTVKERGLR